MSCSCSGGACSRILAARAHAAAGSAFAATTWDVAAAWDAADASADGRAWCTAALACGPCAGEANRACVNLLADTSGALMLSSQRDHRVRVCARRCSVHLRKGTGEAGCCLLCSRHTGSPLAQRLLGAL